MPSSAADEHMRQGVVHQRVSALERSIDAVMSVLQLYASVSFRLTLF